jgi:tRNA (guanine-N7-)-methyltransferase
MVEEKGSSGTAKGLIGGDARLRASRTRVPLLSHPLFLNPVLVAEDAAFLAHWLSSEEVMVEIGFGKGAFLVDLSHMRPQTRILGFEVRRNLCLATMAKLEKAGSSNARILLGDVRSLVDRFVPNQRLAAVFVMFPDPWWKRRHFKKRLFDPGFARLMHAALRPDGVLVVRSDVADVLTLASTALCSHGCFAPLPAPAFDLPATDRERSCQRRGIEYNEIWFARQSDIERGFHG